MITQHPRVLVVDDNEMSRNLIKYRLEMDGIDVVSLSSGEEALEAVARGTVSLIFLDLLMEGLGGLDVLRTLKADERYQNIHVVIVSGVEDVASADAALAAGATDFLAKPVTTSTLSEIVVDLLPLASGAGGTESEAALDPDTFPVFDPIPLAQLVKDYGAETVNGFIFRFQDLAPEQLGAVVAGKASGDAGEWRHAASALKGGARTLGLARLATVCRVVERALDRGLAEDAVQATDTLSHYLGAALVELKAHVAEKQG